MRKLLVFFLIIFVSCQATKNLSNFSLNNKYLTFDKVRLHFDSNTIGEISLKGYISIVRDSLICFKFFGPFSYEVVSGLYSSNFSFFDNYNHRSFPDILMLIFQKSGIILDRNVLEFMLTSDLSAFISELEKLNQVNLRVERIEKKSLNEILIFNDVRNSLLKIQFMMKNSFLDKLSIIYKEDVDHWRVDLNVLEVTNNPKNCNFKF